MIIISDAGPLIALAKTGFLNILHRLFERVIIPPSVFAELKITTGRAGAADLKKAIDDTKWLEVSEPVKVTKVLANSLDMGEAEAITLAAKEKLVLLIDERNGRRIAQKEKIKITGTGAVLVAAKRKGIIAQVAPIMDELTGCGYRISNGIRKKVLELAGEEGN